jgi:hypothetical protein
MSDTASAAFVSTRVAILPAAVHALPEIERDKGETGSA